MQLPGAHGAARSILLGSVALGIVCFGLGYARGIAAQPPPTGGSPSRLEGGVRVRVGIATDLAHLDLACCNPQATVLLDGRRRTLSQGLRVVPATEGAAAFRVQAAALKDEGQADLLARRLATVTGSRADAFFDAGAGLYRIRVGSFAEREEAEAFKTRYRDQGLAEGWVVREGGLRGPAALEVLFGSETHKVAGRWLSVSAGPSATLRVPQGEFRGALLVYLNDRGRLNLVNEVSLEAYLRGVVPLEMGPEVYDELASLRAQAIAARTYAVRNLGQFEEEGYDLCATPRCQVYGGAGAEHPLSDRAISETAGQVLVHEGRLADALYSATCGGFTEDVEVVFPAMSQDYLRGVPCIEGPLTRLPTRIGVGTPLHRGVMDALLGSPGSMVTAAGLQARLAGLASLASLPLPTDSLGSMEVEEVSRFVASAFDLSLDPALLSAAAEGSEDRWTEAEQRLRALLASTGPSPPPALSLDRSEELLFQLALTLSIVRSERLYFQALRNNLVSVRSSAGAEEVELGDRYGAYRRRSGALHSAELSLAAGDRIRLYWQGTKLLALVQEHHETDLGPPARREPWTVNRSLARVRSAVAARYPGFRLQDLSVVERGVSGRVARLRVLGENGESFEIEGLAVRWTLDLPDTLFTVESRSESDGGGWTFHGRGRGHGVGLCQIGAFTMARRGHTYREILQHYYSGITLARLEG